MTSAWVWLDRTVAVAIHDMQLAEHGGAAGVRDAGLLDSALGKPLHLNDYGEPPPDAAALAAFPTVTEFRATTLSLMATSAPVL